MDTSHTKLLVPRAPRDVWQALIHDAELTERGAVLRLVPSRGACELTARITRYESSRLLERRSAGELLRWQIEPQGKNATLLTFTCTPEMLGCFDTQGGDELEAVGEQLTFRS